MSVDAKTVRRIAHLARIAVTDDEVEHLKGELNAILAFVEQLSEVDVKGVPVAKSAVISISERKRALAIIVPPITDVDKLCTKQPRSCSGRWVLSSTKS